MKNKLAISEVFYSIQGEGKTIGIPSVFVRLGGCNLMCGGMGTQFDGELHNGAEWRCDSVEVWMKALSKEVQDVLPKDCVEAIKNDAHLIITGGEPTMQQSGLKSFMQYVKEHINEKAYFEIETNGTIMPDEYLLKNIDLFNCSPKLRNSGMDNNMTFKPDVIKQLNKKNTIFKFVVNSDKELMVTAVKNIDDSIAVVIFNEEKSPKSFMLSLNKTSIKVKINAQAIQTIIIPSKI